ncbi:MAG: hypothetical protein II306_11385, partial [Clostridia bacterium]|nr:hypothetical protein [Clostridia bacterium]
MKKILACFLALLMLFTTLATMVVSADTYNKVLITFDNASERTAVAKIGSDKAASIKTVDGIGTGNVANILFAGTANNMLGVTLTPGWNTVKPVAIKFWAATSTAYADLTVALTKGYSTTNANYLTLDNAASSTAGAWYTADLSKVEDLCLYDTIAFGYASGTQATTEFYVDDITLVYSSETDASAEFKWATMEDWEDGDVSSISLSTSKVTAVSTTNNVSENTITTSTKGVLSKTSAWDASYKTNYITIPLDAEIMKTADDVRVYASNPNSATYKGYYGIVVDNTVYWSSKRIEANVYAYYILGGTFTSTASETYFVTPKNIGNVTGIVFGHYQNSTSYKTDLYIDDVEYAVISTEGSNSSTTEAATTEAATTGAATTEAATTEAATTEAATTEAATTGAATTEATTTEAATTEAATTEAATTATEPSFDRNLNLYNDKKPLKVESAYADQTANSTFVVTEKGSVKITFPAATRAQQYQIQYDLTKLDKAAIEAAGNKLVVTMTGYGSWLKPDGSADGTHTKINVGGVLKAGSDSGSWLKGGNSVTYTLDMTDVDYSKGTMAVIAQNYYGSGLTNVVIEVYLSVPEKVDTTTATATDATTTTAPAEEWVVGQYAPSNGIFTNTAANSQGRIAKTAKMDVTAGKAYKFETGSDNEGIKFILRGYDADGNYVDLAKTSVGNAVLESGGVIVIPEGVAQLSISLYDVNNNANTRGQEMLDMIAAGTLAPTITETTEIPSTTATTATTTQPTTTEPPFDASKYEREALIKWGATMTHWYSKTEGWLSNGVNDGDLGDNITCSKGTMKVNIADVKAQQANINFSMTADSADCKDLNALIDELIEKDAYIECDVKVVSAKKADGTDYQSIKYKLKTNNGDMSKEDNNYTNVGETRTLRYKIADLASFTAEKDVYSAGVMLFGGDWNSGFSELVVEISPIYYLVEKEAPTTDATTTAPAPTTADDTTAPAPTTADDTTAPAPTTADDTTAPVVESPDDPTTVVGGKYETSIVQDPNAPVAADDSINVFTIDDQTVKAGDTIEVPVVLSNVDKIWGAQLNIAFDTNG